MVDWDYGSKGRFWSGAPAWKRLTKPFKCVHVAGLPVAEGAACEIDMCPDKFSVSASGAVFELPKAKVVSIERFTKKQLTQVSKANAGLAVLGGVAFGAAGAVVGASVGKTKTLTRYERFAAFTYSDDGQMKVLIFGYEPSADQMGSDKQTLRKFIKDWEDGSGYRESVTVQL